MKESEDFYGKHYNALLRNIKEYLIKWGGRICSWLRSISIIKMSVLSQK